MRNSVFGLGGLALSTLAIVSSTILPAHAISINDATAAAAGGIGNYFDQNNEYPAVASILRGSASECTGTLINARTVITAAHCFFSGAFDGGPTPTAPGAPVRNVSFGTTATVGTPGNNDRTVTSVIYHKGFGAIDGGDDIAVISLSAPVTTITAVTLATPNTPIPAAGTNVLMVGYGDKGIGTSCCTGIDNKRRVAYSELGAYMTANAFSATDPLTSPFYYVQFRDPLSPNSPNRFNLTAPVSSLQGGPNGGDSGGPLFVSIDGKWVQVGALRGNSTTNTPAGQYGEVNDWTSVAFYYNWIATNNPLRAMTAKSGNHDWSDADAWQDSVAGVTAATPNNFVGNVSNYQTDAAHYYNVTLSNPGAINVDISPTIDNLTINGAGAQLTLPTGSTLTTLTSTKIANGALLLDGGTLHSAAVDMTGGWLSGAGTIRGAGGLGTLTAMTNNGGTIAPLGTMVVRGSFTQDSGTLQVRAPADVNSDFFTVVGTANLGGTLKAVITPGLYGDTRSYTPMTATNLVGDFENVVSSSPFFNASATYTGTTVTMRLDRIGFGAVAGLNANQQAVGNALERGYTGTLTASGETLYSNLFAAQSTGVLTQLSGSATGITQTVATTGGSMFMSSMMDQAAAWRDGDNTSAPSAAPLGYAAEPSKKKGTDAFAALEPHRRAAPARVWQAYGSGFGGWQSLRADANGAGSSQHVGGGAIGFNYQASPDLLVGFSAGVGTSNFASGNSSGDATTGQIGIYGVRTFNNLYVAGALNYGFGKTNTSRVISGLGPTETARGSFHSDQLGGRIEIGHRSVVNGYGITPFAALQASTVWQDGYTENSVTDTGAPGVLGLAYGSQTTTSLPAFLGVQIDKRVAIGSALWTPSLRAAWVHEFRPQTQVSAAFNAIPGSGFTVEGPRAAENALRLELGSTVAFNDRYSLFGKVTAEVSDRSQSFTGNGGVKVAW
ncbi:MAG: autotransporter domain-containing protein [Pseudolabrys sp.]|nr:autotransporter domain-containing protein [Pseudolabrys sp.]